MSALQTKHGAVASVAAYVPASGDLKAILDGMNEGLSIWAKDITPSRIHAANQQIAIVEAALRPTNEGVILSWLHQLRDFVSNPPANDAAMKSSAIAQVCGDLPVGVWTPETRIAWVRQKPRDGYPVGARWPSAAELYQHLEQFARRIRSEQTSLRRLLAKAEQKPEPARQPPTEDAKKYVSELAAKFRSEVAAREAENARRA